SSEPTNFERLHHRIGDPINHYEGNETREGGNDGHPLLRRLDLWCWFGVAHITQSAQNTAKCSTSPFTSFNRHRSRTFCISDPCRTRFGRESGTGTSPAR